MKTSVACFRKSTTVCAHPARCASDAACAPLRLTQILHVRASGRSPSMSSEASCGTPPAGRRPSDAVRRQSVDERQPDANHTTREAILEMKRGKGDRLQDDGDDSRLRALCPARRSNPSIDRFFKGGVGQRANSIAPGTRSHRGQGGTNVRAEIGTERSGRTHACHANNATADTAATPAPRARSPPSSAPLCGRVPVGAAQGTG